MNRFLAAALCGAMPVFVTGAQTTILSREDVAGIPQLRKQISVSLVGVSLETALREIGRQAGLPITYNDRILPAERTVWLTREEIRTDAALEEVLRGSGLRLVALTSGQVVVVKAIEPEQQGSRIQPDTIRGRVTTDSGRVIIGADIIITMAPDREVFRTTTDSAGQYLVYVPNGTGDYLVYIGAADRRPIRRRMTQTGARTALVVDAALGSAAVTQLATVRATVPRPRPRRNDDASFDVGGTSTQFVGVTGALAPDQMGDPNAMLLTTPGVSVTPDGGASAFGLGADANRVTLSGMSFDGTLPRDIHVRSRVGSSFDPTRGGFAGANISMEISPGSLIGLRRGHMTLDTPQLQFGDKASQALGQQYTNASFNVGASGELVPDLWVYSSGLQLKRRTSDATTILSHDLDALRRLGVAPDSVDRFLSLLGSNSIPVSTAGIPGTRANTEISSAFRLDRGTATPILGLVSDQRSIFTVTGIARYAFDEPIGGSALGLPAFGGERNDGYLLLQLGYSRYLDAASAVLSETRTGFSISRAEARPYLRLPEGRVRIASLDPTGVNGIASVGFGGNGGIEATSSTWRWETSSEVTFTPANHLTHRLKFLAESQLEGSDQKSLAGRFGAFTYQSLADFAANRPASFARTLQSLPREGGQWTGALAVADFWTPRNNLSFVFGPRLEYNTFADRPVRNAGVVSAFGIPNDAAPSRWHVSPRFGFTWIYPGVVRAGRGGFATSNIGSMIVAPRGVLRGGFGEFRARMPATLLADARSATGLPGSTIQRITCLGDAVPIPDWASYQTNPLLVPGACADGSTGEFADDAPTVRLVDPSYDAMRAWRANLHWGSAWKNLIYSIEATYSHNLNLPGTRDLNFSGVPRFSMSSEGGRPVFVNPSSIVPATGLSTGMDSRLSTAFGRVIDQVSDLRSNTKQLMLFLHPYTPTSLSRWQVHGWYMFQDHRAQTRGFDGATRADPRTIEWAKGFSPRHVLGTQLGYWLRRPSIIMSLRSSVQSGYPFTPMVAGDINGDGQSNDRAFIFAPGNEPAEISGTMSELMATSPSAVSECLRRQAGKVASTNSCNGPWRLMMNARIDWQRRFFSAGTSRYVNVSLNFSNPLAGIDQLLHGGDNLHGWGSPGFPDRTLYYVRGFDPANQRFLYEVNPRFGNHRPAFTGVSNPFRITLDVSVSVNGDVVQKVAKTYIRPTRRDPGRRPPADTIYRRMASEGVSPAYPLPFVISLSDSLLLTAEQVRALRDTHARLATAYDSTMRSLSVDLSEMPDPVDLKAVTERIRTARSAAFDTARHYVALREILTPLQITLLPADYQRRIRGG